MVRVLVADSCPDTVESLALLLRLWGHPVCGAGDGEAVLREAGRFHPDLVLMDVVLGRLDGYEAARRLRWLPGMAKVVLTAVTGFPDNEHRRRAHDAGFDYYLVKPFDPEQLRLLLFSVAGLHPLLPWRPPRAPHEPESDSEEDAPHRVCLCC